MKGFTPLLQLSQLTDTQRALRDYKGGSAWSAGIVLVVVIGFVLLAYYLTRKQRQHATPPRVNSPRKLLDYLLSKLGADAEQERVLRAVSKHARLKHPSLLLLSDLVFDRHVREWRAREARTGGTGDDARDDVTVERLRTLLFHCERA